MIETETVDNKMLIECFTHQQKDHDFPFNQTTESSEWLSQKVNEPILPEEPMGMSSSEIAESHEGSGPSIDYM